MKMHSMKALAVAALGSFATAGTANAEVIYGLTTQNSIAIIDSTAPSNSVSGGTITGLAQNEILQMIDYRAATGEIYVIGNQSNIYTVDPGTFVATQVGSTLSTPLAGTSFAFDFNPAFDGGSGDPTDIGRFARIISDTDNNRVIDGNTGMYLGSVEKTPVFYAAGDVNEGADPNIVGIAYTNSVPGASSTQQYGIDRATGSVVTVANNAGTLVTIGDGVLPVPTTNEAGLDISGASGIAYAVLQTGPNSNLFTVDLGDGSFTLVGEFASGDLIRDLTVVPIPEPASVGLLALGGLALRRRR